MTQDTLPSPVTLSTPERLRDALERYGQHEEGCNYFADPERLTLCDCGYEAALIDAISSPVSVPEGDARADWVLVPPTATVEECGGNWCVWLDTALPYVYGFATKDEAVVLKVPEIVIDVIAQRDALYAENTRLRKHVAGFHNHSCSEIADTIDAAIVAWKIKVRADARRCLAQGIVTREGQDPPPNEITRLRAENERLRERLEITHVWQSVGGGPLERVPAPEGIPDGIECRDKTIRLQDARITELEGERDDLRSALAVLDKIAWLAAEEDSWFGNENDIAVQRAAAERHRAALSKTEGKGC